MIRFEVNQAKSFFFDTERVMRATTKAERTVLSRFGAFVRRAAKSSIRKRKRISAPGEPPSSHTGVLRQFIFFAYEPERKNVVIGPALTNQLFFDRNALPIKGTVPSVLEEGGTVRILEVQRIDGGWRRADLRSRRRLAGRPTRLRRVDIEARPYMGPAYESTKQDLPEMWQNAIRAA